MDRLDAICKVVYKCGKIIKDAPRDEIGVSEKCEDKRNLVTTYDTMVEGILRKELLEIVPEAVEDAKANASLNGVTNAEFLCADAGQAAAELEAMLN